MEISKEQFYAAWVYTQLLWWCHYLLLRILHEHKYRIPCQLELNSCNMFHWEKKLIVFIDTNSQDEWYITIFSMPINSSIIFLLFIFFCVLICCLKISTSHTRFIARISVIVECNNGRVAYSWPIGGVDYSWAICGVE